MKASALQEFLRNLAGPLAAVGVPSKSLDDLKAVAHALQPFHDLSLEQLSDFLTRAANYRKTGDVPTVAVRGLDEATSTARTLGDAVQALGASGNGNGSETEARIAHGKRDLQSALSTLAGEFGIGVKFSDDKKWLSALKSKGDVARAVESFRRVVSQVSGPDSYQTDSVISAINQLGGLDANVLKLAAAELGVTGKGKGKAFVESVVVKLSGHDSKPPKAGKKPKEEKPAASEEQVAAITKTLQDMVVRAKDPTAVPDSEINTILGQVSSQFSDAQQKAIAAQVTGQGGRSAKDAIDRLRADLTAVKRAMESQNA
jgi:hypothetical protein